jgi:hypothetical protein
MLWRRIVVIVLLIHAVSGLIVEHIRMFDPDGYRDLGKPSTIGGPICALNTARDDK